jgi:ATP-dependent Lon protease
MSNQPLSEPIVKHREINDVRALPVLPVRDTVLFPHAVLPLTVGRESSVQLINSLGEDKTIVVVAQREARVDNPQPSDLYTVGTSAVVHKVVKMPNQSLFVFAEGLERVRLSEFTQLTPFMRGCSAGEFRNRCAAAQCVDLVPADRGRFAHAFGRAFDRGHEY